ncbi:hypothetical protein ACQPW3_23505 [Actinosynnema sp. CA-248983]
MRLTARGVAVVVAAPVCCAVGIFAGYPLFLALGGLLAGRCSRGSPGWRAGFRLR